MLKQLAAAACMAASVAQAGNVSITLTIPTQQVAEYHRPYVALWLEDEKKKATHLALWYDTAMRNNEGQKWLKDLRQWWRRGGRKLSLPADGISGATRKPGTYTLNFTEESPAFSALSNGQYRLRVEVSREVGGREILNLPFTWPITKSQTLDIKGTNELGAVSLTLAP